MIKCNLCDQTFNPDDPLLYHRKKRHEEWHSPTDIKRNTVIGKVEWI